MASLSGVVRGERSLEIVISIDTLRDEVLAALHLERIGESDHGWLLSVSNKKAHLWGEMGLGSEFKLFVVGLEIHS